MTLVRPVLEYSSSAWDPYTKKNTKKLDQIHRSSARFICHNCEHEPGAVTKLLEHLQFDRARTVPSILADTSAKWQPTDPIQTPVQKNNLPSSLWWLYHTSILINAARPRSVDSVMMAHVKWRVHDAVLDAHNTHSGRDG